MSTPRVPAVPHPLVTTMPGHPVLSCVIEFPEQRLAAVISDEAHAECYVTDALDRDTLLKLQAVASDIELYQLLADHIFDDSTWSYSLSELVSHWKDQGLGHIWLSPRSERPLVIDELLDAERSDAEYIDRRFCRDDDCVGDHLWLGIQLVLRPSVGGYFVWHVNVGNGSVVPPTPLVVGRA